MMGERTERTWAFENVFVHIVYRANDVVLKDKVLFSRRLKDKFLVSDSVVKKSLRTVTTFASVCMSEMCILELFL